MRRTLFAAVFALAVISVAHAQDFEGQCARPVDGTNHIDIFLACEPGLANEAGRRQYAEAPWKRKLGALLVCVKSGKASGVESRLRDALELCYNETSR